MNNSGLPKNQRPTLKIILVGSSGVGKTCLISSYFKQSFDFQSIPTVAPAYSCSDVKRSDGTTISLQIWDTAGQERYHSVSKLFFRDSDIAFICFEAGDKISTQEVPNWIKRVREEVPACSIFFVITKSDLHSKEEIIQIKESAIDEFKDLPSKGIFITSALSKEGVNELFNAAADLYQIRVASSHHLNKPTEKKEKNGCC